MSFLVRKITRGKWSVGEHIEAVNADAITQCMKTQDNTLSVWKINEEKDIQNSILAMAAANEFLSKIDVVILSEQALLDREIPISTTPGITPCKDLIDTHRDLSDLNIKHLALISDLIAAKIRNEEVHSFSLGALKNILCSAIDAGKLTTESLSESVKAKVVKHATHLKDSGIKLDGV